MSYTYEIAAGGTPAHWVDYVLTDRPASVLDLLHVTAQWGAGVLQGVYRGMEWCIVTVETL